MDIKTARNINILNNTSYHENTLKFFREEEDFYQNLSLAEECVIDGYIRCKEEMINNLRQIIIDNNLVNDSSVAKVFVEFMEKNA